MKLLALFAPRCHAAAQAAVQPPALRGTGQEDLPPRGCGWFDSSHELLAGLLVSEHAANDACAADFPVAQWLELQLA